MSNISSFLSYYSKFIPYLHNHSLATSKIILSNFLNINTLRNSGHLTVLYFNTFNTSLQLIVTMLQRCCGHTNEAIYQVRQFDVASSLTPLCTTKNRQRYQKDMSDHNCHDSVLFAENTKRGMWMTHAFFFHSLTEPWKINIYTYM